MKAATSDAGLLREQPLSAAFLAAAILMLGLKLMFDLQPQDFPLRDQAAAFTWPVVLLALVLASAGRFAEMRLGWPQNAAGSTWRAGTLHATIAGALYGVITIGQYVVTRSSHPLAKSAWVHLDLPWSVPFYTYGALLLEFVLRLGCLTVLTWFIYAVLLGRRWSAATFWMVNAAVSLYESVPFLEEDARQGAWLSIATTPVQPLYVSNLYEGWLLRRFGWLTPIVFRGVFYALWHVLFGGLLRPLFISQGA